MLSKIYAYVSEVYESNNYIYLECSRGNIDDILIEDYGVDIEEYKERGWGNPRLLEAVKRDYPELFNIDNAILDYLKEYSRVLDIEFF